MVSGHCQVNRALLPELAFKSRGQGPPGRMSLLIVCHHEPGQSTVLPALQAPASACAPNRGLIAHHHTYPTPPFSQGTGLIPSSSFAQPLHETAICLLPLLNSHEMNQPQPQLSVLLLPGHTLRLHAIRQAGAICNSWLPGMSTFNSKEHREALGRDGELVYPDLESRRPKIPRDLKL